MGKRHSQPHHAVLRGVRSVRPRTENAARVRIAKTEGQKAAFAEAAAQRAGEPRPRVPGEYGYVRPKE